MSELEQARAHLLAVQRDFHSIRAYGTNSFGVPLHRIPNGLDKYRDALYAALSWVWDAQERDGVNNINGMVFALRKQGIQEPYVIYRADAAAEYLK